MQTVKLTFIDTQVLTRYLESVQMDFDPPLLDRVANRSDATSFSDYAKKLIEHGEVFVVKNGESEEVMSLIAIYVNDSKHYRAYIPILSVKGSYKGKGMGSLLIQESINCAINRGMNEIHVKTWPNNANAIKLYTKFGFRVENVTNDNILLVKYL